MKVAVVFIGTDKYLNFLPTWYERCEEFFLPGVDKKYLIFTDGSVPESPDNSIVYHQEHLDWPYITLYRFRICLLYTSPSPRDRQKSRMPSSA